MPSTWTGEKGRVDCLGNRREGEVTNLRFSKGGDGNAVASIKKRSTPSPIKREGKRN